ncbi:MAG: S49 family peptidase, partial [Rhizobium ruizarguesonis]
MAGFLRKLLPKRFRKDGLTIPVVKLQGAIVAGGGPFRPTLNLANVSPVLEKAFAMKDAPAVAISINSPGGSPVQSRLIFTRIRELAREKQKKVLVFVE